MYCYFTSSFKTNELKTRNNHFHSCLNDRCTRLVTFPEYLWIQLRKFTLAEDWTPRKMDVAVEIPQTLDISWMKSSGQQNGEILMPDQSSGKSKCSLQGSISVHCIFLSQNSN